LCSNLTSPSLSLFTQIYPHFSFPFHPVSFTFYSLFIQTGFSGNCVVLTVLYCGGVMMTDSLISVGDLTSFLLYTGFVGISVGGKRRV